MPAPDAYANAVAHDEARELAAAIMEEILAKALPGAGIGIGLGALAMALGRLLAALPKHERQRALEALMTIALLEMDR
jgi:hypothetical protein